MSKASVFFLVCSLALCNAVYAQTCNSGTCAGDITLDSLEAITEDIRSARRIVGNLTIGDGEAGTDLTNAHLAALQVEVITGNLTINRTRLTTLDAFSSLRSIEGSLDIGGVYFNDGNKMMTLLSGFGALESIGGRLYMEENDALVTFTAFDRLDSIGGQLRINHNDALRSLSAFPALRHIGTGLGTSVPPIRILINPRLSVCCGVFPFLQSRLLPGYTLGGGRTMNIQRNAEGCNSVTEIKTARICTPPVTGRTIRRDVFLNSIEDITEGIRSATE